ncbi:MAG: RHS repeat-associated core domain-containing protein [Spirulinaceae cyanobacterium]
MLLHFDRLQSETEDGVTTNYTYDNNGNLTLADVAGSLEQVEYVWDVENRLREIRKTDALGATETIEYEYNAQGVRVSSTLNGVKTNYLVDGNRPYAQVLEEYVTDGTNRQTQANYTYGLNLLSQVRVTEELFYLHDGHSGVRQLADEDGMVTDTYHYDAYGNLLGVTGNSENDYLYRGEQYDEFAQMQYLRARYYDPDLGRFSSVDPFEGRLNEPVTTHRYLYGNANPVTFIDPSGETTMAQQGAFQALLNQLSAMAYTTSARAIVAKAALKVGEAVIASGTVGSIFSAANIAIGANAYFWRRNNGGSIWNGTLNFRNLTAGVESNIQLPGFIPSLAFSAEGTLRNNVNQVGVSVGGVGIGIADLLGYKRYSNVASPEFDVELATLDNNERLAFIGLFLATNIRALIPARLQALNPNDWNSYGEFGYIGMGGGASGLGAVGYMLRNTPAPIANPLTVDTYDAALLVGGSWATPVI